MAGLQRLLVMPARQFQRRRSLGGINHGEIVMRIGIARRQLDRATKRRFGRSAQPLSSKHNSEILKGVGVLRIELGGVTNEEPQRIHQIVIDGVR